MPSRSQEPIVPADYPSRLDICPWGAWSDESGASPIRDAYSGYLGIGALFTAVNSSTKWFEWKVFIKSGTWTLTVVHYNNNGYGIIVPSLDGTNLTSIDTHNLASLLNTVTTISGIVVATSGVKALRLTSSSNTPGNPTWRFAIHHITLQRTGA